jgi:hypothetical protein
VVSVLTESDPMNAVIERVDAIEQGYLRLIDSIPEVDQTLDFRGGPKDVIQPNTVCLYFDWEEEVAHTAGGGRGPINVEWWWGVDIWVYGYDAREMQRTIKIIVLKSRELIRANRQIGRDDEGRALSKKTPVLTSRGEVFPVTIQEKPGFTKSYRLVVERQV